MSTCELTLGKSGLRQDEKHVQVFTVDGPSKMGLAAHLYRYLLFLFYKWQTEVLIPTLIISLNLPCFIVILVIIAKRTTWLNILTFDMEHVNAIWNTSVFKNKHLLWCISYTHNTRSNIFDVASTRMSIQSNSNSIWGTWSTHSYYFF